MHYLKLILITLKHLFHIKHTMYLIFETSVDKQLREVRPILICQTLNKDVQSLTRVKQPPKEAQKVAA